MEEMLLRGETMNREETKALFFKLLFQRPGAMKDNPLMPVVSGAFPNLYQRVKEAKGSECKEVEFEELARNCQRTEAKIMLDGVCKNLLNLSPQLVMVTVHDCLMVESEHVATVEQEIKSEFRKWDIFVTLKLKGHSPSRMPAAAEGGIQVPIRQNQKAI